jgi:ribonuclease P protein component
VSAAAERFGRIVRPVEFERVLQTRSRASSPHFAVHHLAAAPTPARRRPPKTLISDLSTSCTTDGTIPVDDSPLADAGSTPLADAEQAIEHVSGAPVHAACDHWLGIVVPKRHARRAVTRSLLKRQIRAAAARHAGVLPPGLWVVRLRAPFDRAAYPSAASTALQQAARGELETVFSRAAASSRPDC